MVDLIGKFETKSVNARLGELQDRVACLEETLYEILNFLDANTQDKPMLEWLNKIKSDFNDW